MYTLNIKYPIPGNLVLNSRRSFTLQKHPIYKLHRIILKSIKPQGASQLYDDIVY